MWTFPLIDTTATGRNRTSTKSFMDGKAKLMSQHTNTTADQRYCYKNKIIKTNTAKYNWFTLKTVLL